MSLRTVLPPGRTTPREGTATAHPGRSASFVSAPPTLIPLQSVLKAPSWKSSGLLRALPQYRISFQVKAGAVLSASSLASI